MVSPGWSATWLPLASIRLIVALDGIVVHVCAGWTAPLPATPILNLVGEPVAFFPIAFSLQQGRRPLSTISTSVAFRW